MKNSAQSVELVNAAYEFAVEIWAGQWRHIFDLATQSSANCPELIQELERRCPGYTEDAYKRALEDGFFAAR